MDDESDTPLEKPVQRLCNEIQLFDLCELNSCDYKEGRFCANQDLLSRFENIAEDDTRLSDRYQDEEPDESEYDEDGYGFEPGIDEYDDECA